MSKEDKLEIAKLAYKEIKQALSYISIYKDIEVEFYWFGVLAVDDDLFTESDLKA